jgi:hypothetical protein
MLRLAKSITQDGKSYCQINFTDVVNGFEFRYASAYEN